MPLIRLLVAPIRRIVSSPFFQLPLAIVVVLVLQAADQRSLLGEIFGALDWLVDRTVTLCAAWFDLRSLTKSSLTIGFMIAYVYIGDFLVLVIVKALVAATVELAARSNAFGLMNAIARGRGIAAYRAWLELERIRPKHIAPEQWEERFAWPADGRPPYPSLLHRMVRATIAYIVALVIVAAILQALTPLPALTWLRTAIGL